MSGGEEVKNLEESLSSVLPAGAVAKEGALTKAQQQTMFRQQEMQRKAEARNRAEYKKELISNNELKQQQVTEIQLNILYYKAKKEWFELLPEIEALEAKEKALVQKEKEDQEKAWKAQQKLMDDAMQKEKEANTPKIIIPEVGKPREK